MPRATFQFVYVGAQRGGAVKPEVQERIGEVLASIDRDALRDEISRQEGYRVAVSDLAVMTDQTGFEVAFDMEAAPRRADSVKKIFDELKKIERRVQIYAHFLISSALGDENWNKTHGVRVVSDMVSTGGFLVVGRARSSSWKFILGFVLGVAVTYYAMNFAVVNEMVSEALGRR